jgi:cysteine desulfurase family protein (TIGR01976 family)
MERRSALGGGKPMSRFSTTPAVDASTAAFATVEAIRGRFPALAREHRGQAVAYFDGPGGTQVPAEVADAVADYLLHHNANARWAYPTSAETDAVLLAAREALADWIGGAAEEIVFGANMTTLTFHLSRALSRHWKPGDAVVVTELDHHANSDTWREAARERGVEVRTIRMRAEDGGLDEQDLLRKVTPGVRLVAITAASNALGTMLDVSRLVALAHAQGALAFVDAVHFAGHAAPDARAWGCDFLACSAYKFYGPHVGVLWGRRALIDSLDAPRLEPANAFASARLETGTLAHEGIAGAGAAVDFLAGLALGAGSRRARLLAISAELHARGRALLRFLWDGLAAIPGVALYGPPPGQPRTPTVAFTVVGHDARAVAAALAEQGLFVSHGNFNALSVARALGRERDGLVRAGCAAYTTAEEVERLIAGVRGIAELS